MESTDPEGLAASQLVLALDIVLRFGNKVAPSKPASTALPLSGATHSAHGLPHLPASRPVPALTTSAPQPYSMPQPAISTQQVRGILVGCLITLNTTRTLPNLIHHAHQMYGPPASQMYSSPLYASAPASIQGPHSHQQSRPTSGYPPFRTPTTA